MRNFVLLIGIAFLIFSCSDEDTQVKDDNETENNGVAKSNSDSLPDTEWNGEYLKITDEEEPKITRKSQGSDFYSMGKVYLKIGETIVDITIFERKKNALVFTNKSITGFIKSAFSDEITLKFKKKDIVVNHKGKYKADPSEKANNSFSMKILAGKKDQKKEFSVESGEAEIINFSPSLGTLEMKIIGNFVDEKGDKLKGEGMIKMNFESSVMMAI